MSWIETGASSLIHRQDRAIGGARFVAPHGDLAALASSELEVDQIGDNALKGLIKEALEEAANSGDHFGEAESGTLRAEIHYREIEPNLGLAELRIFARASFESDPSGALLQSLTELFGSDTLTPAQSVEERDHAVAEVVRHASLVLATERVGLWWLETSPEAIRCSYFVKAGEPDGSMPGLALASKDYPDYFQALIRDHRIVAADAHSHAATKCFSETYLRPNAIGAMLDVPVNISGRARGVLCFEHVGGPRAWTQEEQLAAAVLCDCIGRIHELYSHEELKVREFDALRLSHEVLSTIPTLAGLLDPYGRLLVANRASLELIDQTSEEVLGRYFWDCPWWEGEEESQTKLKRTIEAVRHSRKSIGFETTHQRASDGSKRIIEFRIDPILDGRDQVAYLVPTGTDVTEARAREIGLRNQEERIRQLLSHVDQAITCIEFDPPIQRALSIEDQFYQVMNGYFVEANDHAAEIKGYTSAEEMLGKSFLKDGLEVPIDIDGRPQIDGQMRQLIEKGSFRGELSNEIVKGERRVYQVEKFFIEEDNAYVRLWIVRTDVTDKRRGEERIRQLLSHVSQGITCTEYHPPIDRSLSLEEQLLCTFQGKYVDANDIAAHYKGYESAQDLIGMTLLESGAQIPIQADGTLWVEDFTRDLLMTGKFQNVRHRAPVNGDMRTFRVDGYMIEEEGAWVRMWTVRTDITENVRSEERIRQLLENTSQAICCLE
ncbi:MAG: PAS domain-containing protein, partial [Planctomycetes bacterium]|nr:PAS domain-containing protein [Planctomycetota bacterium]